MAVRTLHTTYRPSAVQLLSTSLAQGPQGGPLVAVAEGPQLSIWDVRGAGRGARVARLSPGPHHGHFFCLAASDAGGAPLIGGPGEGASPAGCSCASRLDACGCAAAGSAAGPDFHYPKQLAVLLPMQHYLISEGGRGRQTAALLSKAAPTSCPGYLLPPLCCAGGERGRRARRAGARPLPFLSGPRTTSPHCAVQALRAASAACWCGTRGSGCSSTAGPTARSTRSLGCTLRRVGAAGSSAALCRRLR